jgi:hypothetical protein
MLERHDGSSWRDEDGSAATEFAVLMPVYLTLFVILLSLGQIVCIRQKVAMTVRTEAWLKTSVNSGAVFRNFTGYGSYSSQQLSPPVGGGGGANANDYLGVTLANQNGGRPSQQGGQGGQGGQGQGGSPFDVSAAEYQARANEAPPQDTKAATDLAWCAFVDGSLDSQGQGGNVNLRPHLEWRQSRGQFSYLPSWIPSFGLGHAAVTPHYSVYVLGRKISDGSGLIERKVYRPGAGANDPLFVGDHHPIEDLPDANFFSISKAPQQQGGFDARFLPPDVPGMDANGQPIFQSEQNANLQPGNITATVPSNSNDSNANDVGIWNTGFRLGGDADQEWSFFKGQLGL